MASPSGTTSAPGSASPTLRPSPRSPTLSAIAVSPPETQANPGFCPGYALLDQIRGSVASFTADGAYDQESVTAAVAERHPEAAIIMPPRSTAVPSETAETAPTQRDRHLHSIAEHGRAAWQEASGYTKRARAEAAIGRFKQVVGDGLRSHTDERRATEVDVAVHALNRMLELGRPISVRIA
ncbi:MAG: transposase [Janthinobacterium lividum]